MYGAFVGVMQGIELWNGLCVPRIVVLALNLIFRGRGGAASLGTVRDDQCPQAIVEQKQWGRPTIHLLRQQSAECRRGAENILEDDDQKDQQKCKQEPSLPKGERVQGA